MVEGEGKGEGEGKVVSKGPRGMTLPDLRGKTILVPCAYFNVPGDEKYTAQVRGWTTFKVKGEQVRGYSLWYPSDKQRGYMIESEVHLFHEHSNIS